MPYDPTRDHYAALGVTPSAPLDEIKRAFRARSRKHHPDRNPGDPRAEERTKALNAAWQTLRDPELRRAYDVARAAHAASAPTPRARTRRVRTPRAAAPAEPAPAAEPGVSALVWGVEQAARSASPLAALGWIAFGVVATAVEAHSAKLTGAPVTRWPHARPSRRRT
jgi:curved DNA-binding protein CbpA